MAEAEHAGDAGPEGPIRRLAVVLHGDVAGYSRLMELDEAGTHARLMASRQLIDAALDRHGGTLIGTAGDAVLATFSSVTEGLTAAIAMQQAIAESNTGVPPEEQLLFRIGLNLGDVIVDGDDIFGTGVNVAARLETLAEPGGIVVAGAVRDQAIGKLGVDFVDRGLCRVKNIAEPIRVFTVAESVGGSRVRGKPLQFPRFWRWGVAIVLLVAVLAGVTVVVPAWRPATDYVATALPADAASGGLAQGGKPVIAVLPFDDRGGGDDQGYFSDGVTEDVIGALGRFSGLRVLSWNAVAPYRDGTAPIEELGGALGARYLVSGSIHRSGDRLRASAQLSDADQGVLLWSERYDEELADVFAVQDRISRQLVAALAVGVTSAERARAFAKRTDKLGAYDLVLRGRDLLRNPDRDANFAARTMFERAITIDPNYADAHVDLGATYLNDFLYGWTQWPDRAVREAEEQVSIALEMDPFNAHGHVLRADILRFRGDYSAAEQAINRALDLNPNSAAGHAIRGGIMAYSGRPEQAVADLETALQIDPYPRQLWVVNLGQAYYLSGRYDDTVALFERHPGEPGESPAWHAILAAAHAQLDDIDAAAAEKRQLLRTSPFFDAEAYARSVATGEQTEHILAGLRMAGF